MLFVYVANSHVLDVPELMFCRNDECRLPTARFRLAVLVLQLDDAVGVVFALQLVLCDHPLLTRAVALLKLGYR